MVEIGEPAWRGRQLAEAIYHQRLNNLNEITTFSKSLREKLAASGWAVGRPAIAQIFQSIDGTERYLVQGSGGTGETVETVWMPEGDDGEAGDSTEADPEPGEKISLAASRSRARAGHASGSSGGMNRSTLRHSTSARMASEALASAASSATMEGSAGRDVGATPSPASVASCGGVGVNSSVSGEKPKTNPALSPDASG